MRSLDEDNWYENCQYKFEYVNREVKELKNKEKLDIYDEIKLNTLLNVLKSPMDYANRALAIFFGENSQSNIYIPFRQEKDTKENFEKKISNQIGCVNKKIFNIFDKLFKDKTFSIFNKMQNDEKHVHINTHYKEVKHTTEFSFFNNISETNSFTRGENQNIIKMGNGSGDSSKLQEYYYEESNYFYYKSEKVDEVFTFLNKVENMAKEFVEDIKDYIDTSNKTPN